MASPDDSHRRARRPLTWGALSAVGLAGLVLSACTASSASHPAAIKVKPTTTTTTAPPPTCPLTGAAAPLGGINPVIANINASPIVNVDLGASDSLMIHPAGRVSPDADFTSTSLVYGTHPNMTTPPQPLFTYSDTTPPGGSPVSTVNIDFSDTSNVAWKYNAPLHAFQRFYNGNQPDMLMDGVQNTAANVVVQYVPISYGPWAENDQGGLEVQAAMYPNASGAAVVYRSGVAVAATWHRSTLGSPTQFVNAFGVPIPMQPGQTWLELVPSTVTATTTP